MKNWQIWLKGLFAAIISGAANGLVLIMVDPATFNFQDGLKDLATAVVAFGVWSAALYLKQSPLPNGNGKTPEIKP